jgi:trehalose/maltose hydrolase-like predicted phosphorylase
MEGPINPPDAGAMEPGELPAYLSNGVIGLRIRPNALSAGMTLVTGFTGEHPVRQIEAAAVAPYPFAADLQLAGVWMSDLPGAVTLVRQSYDFSAGELTSRLRFGIGDLTADIEVLTFVSRSEPSIACQELSVTLNQDASIALRSLVDTRGIAGRALRSGHEAPGGGDIGDGRLLWESGGGLSVVGIAYATQLVGGQSEPEASALDGSGMRTQHSLSALGGVTYRLRQIASLTPGALHQQPDLEAARLAYWAKSLGFDELRARNRACWAELWKSRIRIIGDDRWQAMADAAFYYLMSSVHVGSSASTSIFGLATWHDYHYYYGHVMWDIETFCVPPLTVLQPAAAQSLLDYRSRNLPGAARNAQLRGRRGLQFPWESAPRSGEEAAPLPATAAWHEDHVSLDVALAFATYADISGDGRFLRERAWPVLAGVAEWIKSRVTHTSRGYEILESMGIAERETSVANPIFTNLSARKVLATATRMAGALGLKCDPVWADIATALVVPEADGVLISHDGYRPEEEKGETPDPLTAFFPLETPLPGPLEQATLRACLERADDYVGAPMLSALLGAWAARTGDRQAARHWLEEGYAKFCVGRFSQTLEYRKDKFPEQTPAAPFFANLGGFLMSLIFGFPRIAPSDASPDSWPCGEVVLPAGWDAIEIDQLWIGDTAWRLRATHGQVAQLERA